MPKHPVGAIKLHCADHSAALVTFAESRVTLCTRNTLIHISFQTGKAEVQEGGVLDSWHVGHLSVCRLHEVSLCKKQLSSSPLFSAAGINTSGEHQDVSFALKILELFKVHPAASLMDQARLFGGGAEITVYGLSLQPFSSTSVSRSFFWKIYF